MCNFLFENAVIITNLPYLDLLMKHKIHEGENIHFKSDSHFCNGQTDGPSITAVFSDNTFFHCPNRAKCFSLFRLKHLA